MPTQMHFHKCPSPGVFFTSQRLGILQIELPSRLLLEETVRGSQYGRLRNFSDIQSHLKLHFLDFLIDFFYSMNLHSYLFLSHTRAVCTRSFSSAKFPKPPTLSNPPGSAEEVALARVWLKDFSQCSIPRDEVEMTFARSSGPGGQNVNKVNTKATIRCSLDKSWIPPWARMQLRNNPAYVASSNSLLVSSTQTRSQAQNIDDCFKKLHAIIYDVCSSIIPTPPDSERMARKRDHERAMKARNRASKMYRSAVKSNRRGD